MRWSSGWPRSAATSPYALGPGVRPSDHRQTAGVGLHPASGSHLMKPIRNWHQSGVRRPPEQLGIIRVTLPLGGLALGMVAAAGTCPPVCADSDVHRPVPPRTRAVAHRNFILNETCRIGG